MTQYVKHVNQYYGSAISYIPYPTPHYTMNMLPSFMKFIGVLVCTCMFLYQMVEVLGYYWDENIFQSTKTQTYSGSWITPTITFCPDPPVHTEDALQDIR